MNVPLFLTQLVPILFLAINVHIPEWKTRTPERERRHWRAERTEVVKKLTHDSIDRVSRRPLRQHAVPWDMCLGTEGSDCGGKAHLVLHLFYLQVVWPWTGSVTF